MQERAHLNYWSITFSRADKVPCFSHKQFKVVHTLNHELGLQTLLLNITKTLGK